MADRKLSRTVFVGGVEYAAGTAETDIDSSHLELITNPKAWDAEAAAVVGNVATGPTANYVQVENPLPRAEAPLKDDAEGGDKPAKAVPAKKAAAPKAS